MKQVIVLTLVALSSSFLKGQIVICYDNLDSIEIRLIDLIFEPQELKVEPSYYDHKEYVHDNITDTLFLYVIEVANGRIEKSISTGEDTVSLLLPRIEEYLRIVFASDPYTYSEYILPERNSFDECIINEIRNDWVTIYITEEHKYSLKLSLPTPGRE